MKDKVAMTTKQVQRPSHDHPTTWPGFLTRIVEIAAESWPKTFRVICLLIALALIGLAWRWLPAIW